MAITSLLISCLAIAGEPPKRTLTVAKDTTYISGPLRADGVVDYETALNVLNGLARPEENAAAALATLAGPSITDPVVAATFFRQLGVAQPAQDGRYLIGHNDFLIERGNRRSSGAEEPLETAMKEPWSPPKYPALAELLARNAPLLDDLAGASKRPAFVYPLLSGRDPPFLLSVQLGPAQSARAGGQLLALRAMTRLDQHDIRGALADLDAVRRWGILVGSGKRFLIEGLVSNRLYLTAMLAERSVAFSLLATPELLDARAKLLETEPPPFDVRTSLNEVERLSVLSIAAYSIVYGLDRAAFGGEERKGRLEPLAEMLRRSEFDADESLRVINRFYDRAAKAIQSADSLKGTGELALMGRELAKHRREREERDKTFFLFRDAPKLPRGPAAANGEEFGLLCLEFFAPSMDMALVDGVKARVHQRLTVLAYALSAYRRRHGDYPASLDAATLGLKSATIQDPFTGRDFVYRTENKKRQVICAWSDGVVGPYPRGGRLKPMPPDDVILELP